MIRFFLFFFLCGNGLLFSQVGVSFEVRNEHLRNNVYEFDIYMTADSAGTYLTRGQVYVSYNPEAFGHNVVKEGKLSVSPLELLAETFAENPKYNTINIIDNGNRFAITFQSNFLMLPAEDKFHTKVPYYPTPLYHISIPMKDPGAGAGLAFDLQLMKGQQFYFWEGEKKEFPYRSGQLPEEELVLSVEKANHHDIRLSWTTAAEYNSAHFIVEKRRGDSRFEAIQKVKAAGNSLQTRKYQYLDQSGMANTNYYRLKMVGKDGGFSYSEVVEVRFNYYKNDKFKVGPSPTRDFLTLKATGRLDGDYTFVITDIKGRVHYQGIIPQEAEKNRLRITVNHLDEATYYVTFTSPAGKNYLSKFDKIP